MKLRMTQLAAAIALMAASSFCMADSISQKIDATGGARDLPGASAAGVVAKLNYQSKLGPAHGFMARTSYAGPDNGVVHRIAHTYNNVRILGSESVLLLDANGNTLSESGSDLRLGLLGNPALGKAAPVLSVQPTLSASEVIRRTLATLTPNAALVSSHAATPSAELIIYPLQTTVRIESAKNKPVPELNAMDLQTVVTGYKLAYLVQTRIRLGAQLQYRDSVVDAHDGTILAQSDALHSLAGTGKSQYSGKRTIDTSLIGGVYKMIDTSRGKGGANGGLAVLDMNHGSGISGTVYSNTVNTWGDGLNYNGGSTSNANGQTAAVDAMWGLRNFWDLMKNTQGWQGMDGNNTASYIGVHVNTAFENAYYDDTCKCMLIGDGGAMFKQLGSLDIIGHELAHGVTNATAGLGSGTEAGALNEGTSDITGQMVEAYANAGGKGNVIPNSGNDWLIAKTISKTGTPLRYMYKPSKDGHSPDAWSNKMGTMDIHYASGPINRMFYFLAKGSSASASSDYYSAFLTKAPLAMVGIGNDKAYKIWFRALTTKFTYTTNYADAQVKCVAAATDLYGANSREVIAVKRAFAAINVGADVTGG